MKFSLSTFFVRAKRFFRENPGAVFVLGFQILLATCAVLLVSGLSFLAEGVAVVAYFLLVVGVVLQLVCFLRSRHGE
jgi:heme/copper-type cytochrome/quinol oxidase subunit 4